MTSNPPPAAAAAVTAAAKPSLPGIKSFEKCQSELHPQYHLLEEVAVNMLLATGESGVCSLPSGSHSSGRWNDLLMELFHGNYTNGTRDGNGVLSHYKQWTSNNPAVTKLKPLVMGIIKHFSSAHAQNSSALVLLANNLEREMKAAQKDKDESANEVAARRIQNESAESELGFRTPGHGVNGPSLQRPTYASDVAALAALAQPTGSIVQSRAVSASASAAAVSAASAVGVGVDASRSNAVERALAALAAGKPDTVTKKVGPLESFTTGRNQLDKHVLTDGLESSLDKTSDGVMKAFKMLTGSPTTKRQKTSKSIQERINLIVAEIKELQSMGPEFAEDLQEAKAQFRLLQQERKNLREVTKNLDKDLAKSGE